MIHGVLGTSLQLVKMAPVMERLQRRGVAWRFIQTGQHQGTIPEMLDELGIRGPEVVLHRSAEVVSPPQMTVWIAKILFKCLFFRREILGESALVQSAPPVPREAYAAPGRAALPRTLLPEQVGSFERLLWAPRARRRTLADALAVSRKVALRGDHVPEDAFALVSLHRSENILRRRCLARMVGTVEEIARTRRVLFILRPPLARRQKRLGLDETLRRNPRVELCPRCTYSDFVALRLRADLVVTDWGERPGGVELPERPVLADAQLDRAAGRAGPQRRGLRLRRRGHRVLPRRPRGAPPRTGTGVAQPLRRDPDYPRQHRGGAEDDAGARPTSIPPSEKQSATRAAAARITATCARAAPGQGARGRAVSCGLQAGSLRPRGG
jgi:UDP-N-acetylglucosamine 2-epimerase (non-hydrolysing)